MVSASKSKSTSQPSLLHSTRETTKMTEVSILFLLVCSKNIQVPFERYIQFTEFIVLYTTTQQTLPRKNLKH